MNQVGLEKLHIFFSFFHCTQAGYMQYILIEIITFYMRFKEKMRMME